MADAAQDDEIILDIKDSARRRVICGLRWNPMAEGGSSSSLGRSRANLSGATNAHDLDLLCLTFDKFGRFMEGITGQEGQRTGDSGNIYHTGDVIDGEDSLDDEQISLELFNLSSKIHQIVFIAEVQSAHTFGEIDSPEIRIANAIDDHNFDYAFLGRGNGEDKDAYIFGMICRRPQGWAFKRIGQYLEGHTVEDWAELVIPHLEIKESGGPGGIMSAMPKKGNAVPLNYTPQARHRIVCGLNWDPMQENIGRAEKLKNMGQNVASFDLDLACVMYNSDGEPVDGVSAKPDETIDSSGKVYHSGDDTSGEGDKVDDEAISVELKDLPDYIHHVIFLAEIQSMHTFDEINNPSMRIADGKTNDDQLISNLSGPAAQGKTAYVFARISRDGFAWTLTYIDEYGVSAEIDDWIGYLERYLG
ncbi:MAG: TerD family protein [Rhodospirillales bacterium]|nr:TerD family protein [Rhodospirillales bacterium]MCB9995853.1 TerD family protein [Rhodospirillales bacterium]